MYIVRWLMGHPILATWFVGAIAILLSIGNHGAKEDLHDDHASKQEQVETTLATKSPEKPSAVTSALIESEEKKAIAEESATPAVETVVEKVEKIEDTASASEETKSAVAEEAEAPEVESTKTEKAEEPSVTADNTATAKNATTQEEVVVTKEVVTEEVVTETTVDSTVATNRSYPDGLTVGPGSTKTELTEEKTVEKEEIEVEKEAGQTGTQADIATAATEAEAASTLTETPKPAETTADTKSIEDLGQSSTEEMLLMAREAYWNNGLEEASQIYTQLIELEPTVIEYRGELGNVYWRQGYPKKAAQLYSEIAIPMIEQGNAERVANMIGFIGLFYPDRAAEIHKKLQSVKP